MRLSSRSWTAGLSILDKSGGAARTSTVNADQHRRLGHKGVTAVCVDPGSVYSGIWDTSKAFGRPPLVWLLQACYSPVSDGASAPIYAATTPTEELVPGAPSIHSEVCLPGNTHLVAKEPR
eukprot:1109031-Prorocentrum_minimum.AAC.2